MCRVLFTSPHCLIDASSGAAIATGDALELLARNGFECRAFCASKLDLPGEERFEQLLVDLRVKFRIRESWFAGQPVRFASVELGRVPVTVFRSRSTRPDVWLPHEPAAVLAAFERTLDEFRPDVRLTYGGDPVARAMIRVARNCRERRVESREPEGRSKIVFGLHNFAYNDTELFRDVDAVVVPSEFARAWYQERLGIECHVLPYVVMPERVESGERIPARREV
jgi:hypothetical protein